MTITTSARRLTAVAGIATAAMLAVAGCSSTPSTTTPTSGATDLAKPDHVVQISVGVTPIANAATVYLANKLGYFADENLEVTPQIIQAAAAAVPSLQNNELQFALISAVPTITAASKGLPLQVVASNDHYNPDATATDAAALVAAKGSSVTSMSGLAGATIAIVGLKSAPELATRIALKAAGVDPGSVKFVEIAYPDMVAALQSGTVNAAVVVDPYLSQAKAAGLTVLGQPFLDGLHGQAGTLWVGSSNWISSNQAAAAAFVRAIDKAVEYAAANPDAVRDIMTTYTKTDPAVIAKSLLPYFDDELGTADLQYYADAMAQYGFITGAYDASGLLWKP